MRYCTKHTHIACKTHTHTYIHKLHTHTCASSTSRGELGPGTKLIPSILSWSQQNDLKTTFLIILSHQIKRTLRLSKRKKKKEKKGKKKGFLPLTQKGFLKASTSAQQKFRTIMTDCTKLRECHKSCYTLLRLSHRTWLEPTFTFPASRYGRFAL